MHSKQDQRVDAGFYSSHSRGENDQMFKSRMKLLYTIMYHMINAETVTAVQTIHNVTIRKKRNNSEGAKLPVREYVNVYRNS